MRTCAVVLALLSAGCGEPLPDEPSAVDVRVVYVSRLPSGCPDSDSLCYAGCAHHNAPAGLQAIVPLWGTDTVRLTEASAGRYEGVMSIFLNGTKLTKVVREGLPAGVTAALEFSVSGSGTIRQ